MPCLIKTGLVAAAGAAAVTAGAVGEHTQPIGAHCAIGMVQGVQLATDGYTFEAMSERGHAAALHRRQKAHEKQQHSAGAAQPAEQQAKRLVEGVLAREEQKALTLQKKNRPGHAKNGS